jgi:hypothetical protein
VDAEYLLPAHHTPNEMTKWVAGDLGLAFTIVSAVVAVIFWAKRDELPLRADKVV